MTPILIQVISADIPTLLISHVKTTPWLNIAVKNVKEENKSDRLKKENKGCFNAMREKNGQ